MSLDRFLVVAKQCFPICGQQEGFGVNHNHKGQSQTDCLYVKHGLSFLKSFVQLAFKTMLIALVVVA